MREWTVPAHLEGVRLDQALCELSAEFSRRRSRALIEQGSVYLDGKRIRVQSRTVAAGAVLGLSTGQVQDRASAPAEVLWESRGALVVNKPSGVPLVPTRQASAGCVLDRLARDRGLPAASLRPVHRLDQPVSGAVLVALDRGTAAAFSAALRGGQIQKTYVAWVWGFPESAEGAWTWPLSRGGGGFVRVSDSGRPAETRYRLLQRGERGSLLELVPVTGRTHQLRVHCAHAGHPILGDRKYGGRGPEASRLLLHSRRIAFPAPEGGGTVAVEAPLPDDFRMTDPR